LFIQILAKIKIISKGVQNVSSFLIFSMPSLSPECAFYINCTYRYLERYANRFEVMNSPFERAPAITGGRYGEHLSPTSLMSIFIFLRATRRRVHFRFFPLPLIYVCAELVCHMCIYNLNSQCQVQVFSPTTALTIKGVTFIVLLPAFVTYSITNGYIASHMRVCCIMDTERARAAESQRTSTQERQCDNCVSLARSLCIIYCTWPFAARIFYLPCKMCVCALPARRWEKCTCGHPLHVFPQEAM